MIWLIPKIILCMFLIVVFCSFMITLDHEFGKTWWNSFKKNIPLMLFMAFAVAVMAATNYIHESNITLNMAGTAL